jgi:hypothetical protein
MPAYDRRQGDLGNIVELGHLNLRVPEQRLATIFYVSGLGLTRDPYMMTGVDNMWINAGRTQFHLPTGAPQVLRGEIGLVLPDLAALRRRLEAVAPLLAGTRHAVAEASDGLHVTCPWGNRMHCRPPTDPRHPLGIDVVTFTAPPGSLPGICRFYQDIIGAQATLHANAARVVAGDSQGLVFREGAADAAYDGHHVQVTLADFSGPYARLAARDLITSEDDPYQYRFRDIVDCDSGRSLFSVEHEVRSLRHPMFARPLVNRNPLQTNRHYRPGQDAFIPPA